MAHDKRRPSASKDIEIREPMEGLSAAELGQQLGGLGDEAVRSRECQGKLFCVLEPGRKRGNLYPAFQAWPGITGTPLESVLATLSAAGVTHGSVIHAFFAGTTDLLGGLTPVEALLGRLTSPRALDPQSIEFLDRPAQERLEYVNGVAKAYAATAIA